MFQNISHILEQALTTFRGREPTRAYDFKFTKRMCRLQKKIEN